MSFLPPTKCSRPGSGVPEEPWFLCRRMVLRTRTGRSMCLLLGCCFPQALSVGRVRTVWVYAVIYVCVLMSLYIENHEVTLMPLILIQDCRNRNFLETPFSGGEEPDSPYPEPVYLRDQSSWIEHISPLCSPCSVSLQGCPDPNISPVGL